MAKGTRVTHETFGPGKIVYVFNRDIISDIVVIQFDSGYRAKFPADSPRLCV